MSVPRIRLETVEAIARKILMEYDSSLLSSEPRPIPIEATEKELLDELNMERSVFYDRKKEAIYLFSICLFGYVIPELMDGVPRLYPD